LACDTRLLGVQVFSPYKANFKPPLEVVVMTSKLPIECHNMTFMKNSKRLFEN
jgi:hypothetical protein